MGMLWTELRIAIAYAVIDLSIAIKSWRDITDLAQTQRPHGDVMSAPPVGTLSHHSQGHMLGMLGLPDRVWSVEWRCSIRLDLVPPPHPLSVAVADSNRDRQTNCLGISGRRLPLGVLIKAGKASS